MMVKICDLICLFDILLIGYYGVVSVGVKFGLMVYIVGVGLVGMVVVVLVCLFGVVVMIVGDMNVECFVYVWVMGFEMVDLFKDVLFGE